MQENVSLFFTDAGANKEYHVQLKEQADGCVVNFQYGPRGGTLKSGTKTSSPIPLGQAKKVYDRLVAEKMGKGYSPFESGSIYQGTPKDANFTGVTPQLLNAIDEKTRDLLIADPAWGLQEKYDGERRMIRSKDGQVIGINRKGLVVSLPQALADEALEAKRNVVLDGELVGERFYAFDLLEIGSQDLRSHPYKDRIAILTSMFDAPGRSGSIQVVETSLSTQAKCAVFASLKAKGKEGLVFKLMTSIYSPGRPNSGGSHLKFKFVERASLKVASIHPSKRSVSLEGYDENRMTVPLGNVTIPPNHKIPSVGTIVDVDYLYAFPGGSVYQPVYRGERADIETSACTVAQLKMKPANADDEDMDKDRDEVFEAEPLRMKVGMGR